MNHNAEPADLLPRIAVLGAGAMGCLFGAFLAESGVRVLLVDTWREHVAMLNKNGITMETPAGCRSVTDVSATCDYAALRDATIVFVFVKAAATEAAIRKAVSCVPCNTIFVTLQNGLGNIEALCRHLSHTRIVAGTTACGAALLGPGRVRVGGIAQTVLGTLDGGEASRAEALALLLSRAGLPARCAGNIVGSMWTKLLVNVGINAIAALTCLPNGAIFAAPEGDELAVKAVDEAVLVAKAKGIQLETDDPVGHVRAVAEATASNTASMLQDIQAARLTEIDAINGAIVREGRALGIPVPVNETLVALVRLRQSLFESR